MTKSTISIRSNLMIEDALHVPKESYLPGDFLRIVRPSFFDRRTRDQIVSALQIGEYERYLVCQVCGRTCAGTCE